MRYINEMETDLDLKENSRALISRKVAEEGAGIGYVIRDEWVGKDSGWRFYSGDEDALFFMEPDHMIWASLKEIADAYPELEPLLNAPAGSEYRRDQDGIFRPAEKTPETADRALIRALAERQGRGRDPFRFVIVLAVLAAVYLIIRALLG